MDDYGNAARWPEFRDTCFAHGIKAGVWFTDSWNLVNCPPDARFVVGELESEGDYTGCINAINRLPAIPRAVITNFNPLSDASGAYLPDKAAPIINAGFRCLTEAYLGTSSNLTPDRLHFTATQKLGWPDSQPVFGLFNSSLDMYSEWMQGGWSTYLGEYDPRLV